MKLTFKSMKNTALLALACTILAGCVNGPLYPTTLCDPHKPYLIGCYYNGCTEYRPNYFYRCKDSKCKTYSPYAPNQCDPHPYYTQCKKTCCPPPTAWSSYV